MDGWIERLTERKGTPRLWIERLILFSEPDFDHSIRAITLRPGLNLIWAHEPEDKRAYTGTHAAGHGVGKTSLCLLLRYCLGDDADAVVELRETLYREYPKGGVGAVIHVKNERFAIFRYFNIHRDGMARLDGDLEALLERGGDRSFKDFEAHLADALMSAVFPRAIPETGQAIRWQHVLGWVARDQGTGFKRFYAWRDGEGTGLKRSRLDPPVVVRAVLGLLDRGESALLKRIHDLEHEREACQQETQRLRQEPELIRRRIESELRAWAEAAPDLPMYGEDLFADSVEKRIRASMGKASKDLAEIDLQIEAADEAWVGANAEYLLHKRAYDEADAEYQRADAAQKSDEAAFVANRDRLARLRGLAGQDCQEGRVDLGKCRHIQEEIHKLETAINLKDRRNQRVLAEALEDWTARTVAALDRRDKLWPAMEAARQRVSEKERLRRELQGRRNRAVAEMAQGERLREELDRWSKLSGSKEAEEAIAQSVERCKQIEQAIDRARTELAVLQTNKSDRERDLSSLVDALTQALLPDGAVGWFAARDEERPFQLSIRGGEAYRVLEVLLGDLACLLDATASAFPGLLIHDCPREADMSAGLYEAFLLLAGRIEREAFGNVAPFQYIVTTTTPPPAPLRKLPYLRERLDPSTDDGLLFRRRFRSPTGGDPLQEM